MFVKKIKNFYLRCLLRLFLFVIVIVGSYFAICLVLGKPLIVKINDELHFTTVREFRGDFSQLPDGKGRVVPDSFKYFTNLRTFTLYNSADDNTDYLKNMTKLEYLDYADFDGTLDFASLKNMKKLRTLFTIDCENITNWSEVENLVSLEGLYVPNKGITDLSPLANLQNLKHLDISGSKEITDYSVLLELDSLTGIWFSRGQIPEDMVKKIDEKTAENRARMEKEGLSND